MAIFIWFSLNANFNPFRSLSSAHNIGSFYNNVILIIQ